jgi:uncharacterized protein YndB with AHSA1/START domain
MQKLHFSIEINAPREKVWSVLWDDAGFRDWSSVFAEGSHYVINDWKEGSKIQFIDPKANAGMSSMIDKLVPNEFISFKHMTEIKDGKEQPPPHWSGMIENYTLKEDGGATTLVVEMDAPDEFKAMFEDNFPKALARVKKLAEGK